MKALLMHPDRDFDLQQPAPWNEHDTMQDLELDTLLNVMSGSDEFILDVARKAVLSGMGNDLETILYRQGILRDCQKNPAIVIELYKLSSDAIEAGKRQWWGRSSEYASSMLHSSNDLLKEYIGVLRKLRTIAEGHGLRFNSNGFTRLFDMFRHELNEDYLTTLEGNLTVLKFRKGVLISAALGENNEGIKYLLRQNQDKSQNWLERILGKRLPGFTFHLDPHDEAGGRIMSEMRTRGIARVALALAQSADHVVNFFKMLKAELAFHIGCVNLHQVLAAKGLPTCFPVPRTAGERTHSFAGLYDVCLALRTDEGTVVGNTVTGDGKNVVVITGANQGGKSTFLRSVGLAQLMMQCGSFVAAESFTAGLCPSLITHFRREEDAAMHSGKLDEELARMSEIVDHIGPDSMVLFNESFAATNEREGSEIARQVVCGLSERLVRVFYVTHLYEFAQKLFEGGRQDALFLRAERQEDGARTFRLVIGEPLQTSFGADLYNEVFKVSTSAIAPSRRESVLRDLRGPSSTA